MPQRALYVVGDSISIDYGPHLHAALPGWISYDRKGGAGAQLTDPLQATGANGGDSQMVLAHLREVFARPGFAPDLVLVNAGLHDIKRQEGRIQVEADAYRANLTAIVELVRAHGSIFAWVRTSPLDEIRHNGRQASFRRHEADHAAYDRIALAVMAGCRVPVADLGPVTAAVGGSLPFRDHVHFIPAVCQAQGGVVAGFVSGLLAADMVEVSLP